jgi:sulfur-oxidizing protein SoxY
MPTMSFIYATMIAPRAPHATHAPGGRATALLAWLLLGLCGPSFALGDGQTPASGAWDYLQKQIRVIIDNNPSPVAATFDVAAGARVAEIGLRLRIDRFTSVRAIAETSDGKFEMRSTWVNASGGCSAPPSAAGAGTLGDIRFRPSADTKSMLISIRHPNNSGFQIDARSGEPIPPHYISHIRFSTDGRTLLEAETGISLSENPTLRIASDRPLPAPIMIDIVDSKDAHFNASWRSGTAESAAANSAAGAGGTR